MICPKCGSGNPADASNCVSCNVSLAYAREHPEVWQKDDAETRAQIEYEKACAELMQNMIVTTTVVLQGLQVVAYLGVVSSAVVLGTGLWTEFSGDVADLFGSRSGAFQEKLNAGTKAALGELKHQVIERQGNALIGVDIDYMTGAKNLLMVCATGTAVHVEAAVAAPKQELAA